MCHLKWLSLSLLLLLLTACAGPQAPKPLADPIAIPSPTAPVKRFELVAKKADLTIDEGVIFKAFTFDGKSPGPLLVVDEGDTVEITVRNDDTSAKDAPRIKEIRSDGPIKALPSPPRRVAAPFEIGSSDLDKPVR